MCDPHRLKRISHDRKSKQLKDGNINHESPGCLVYSIGSNGDFRFETGLQELLGDRYDVCEIHIFDMGDYEGEMPKGLNIHYHRWGLKKHSNLKESNPSVEIEKGKEFYSLEETVKLLGHENRETIDIFKIDCDKCEWRTWQEWFGPSIPMLQQILVETHNTPKDYVAPFFDGIMSRGYVMFHKEANIQFADGDCIEFGFLKLSDEFFGTNII